MMQFYNDIIEETYFCKFVPSTNYQWRVHVGNSFKKENLIFELSLFDADLIQRDFADIPPITIDLIELATAVYAVDRSIHPDKMSHCRVIVTLPVRCPDQLGQQQIHDKLSEILHWYTGYEWHFNFIKRDISGRSSENPQLFNWRDASKPIDIALWSGGLDCLAGLYNRAFEDQERQFVLCGTGANTNVWSLQKQIVTALPDEIAHRVKLLRVRYDTEALLGQMPDEPRMRSRGFTFMLIGSVCAYLEGSRTLQVYENGIGAINLRFRESEVGLNRAHSVHPLSMMLIADWLSQLFQEPFKIVNPYLFQTKAQMCSIFRSQDLDVVFRTETCDRKHRKADAKQCGQCSSCILRRHALAAAGIHDQTPYVYNDSNWLYGAVNFEFVSDGNHIPVVLHQVRNWSDHLKAHDRWNSFSVQYESLAADIVDPTSSYFGLSEQEMRNSLVQLFSQYLNEWHSLQSLR